MIDYLLEQEVSIWLFDMKAGREANVNGKLIKCRDKYIVIECFDTFDGDCDVNLQIRFSDNRIKQVIDSSIFLE